jgi:hypothetical protein
MIEMIHINQLNHLNHGSDNSIGATLQYFTIRMRHAKLYGQSAIGFSLLPSLSRNPVLKSQEFAKNPQKIVPDYKYNLEPLY